MTDALFHIIAIFVALLGVVRGWRRGLTGLVTSVLGLAFGVVCAHIFCDAAGEIAEGILPRQLMARSGWYLASNLGAGAVYFLVFLLFSTITKVIRDALDDGSTALLNSLLGAIFCVANYLLMLSVAYNIGVGLNPEGRLMRYGRADDGNIIEAVMWIAPAALGSESFGEFAHEEQLRKARTISQWLPGRGGAPLSAPAMQPNGVAARYTYERLSGLRCNHQQLQDKTQNIKNNA